MKINQMAFAYAHAKVGGAFYVICWLLARFGGGSLIWIANLWFHSLDLSALPMKTLDLGSAIVGLITWTVFAGAWGYFVAWVYNMAAKK